MDGKLLERVVAKVVCQHLSDQYFLSIQQYGFRFGRYTSDKVMILSRHWQDAHDSDQDTDVVALDIAGAFDRM